ncbi:MAG TPA: hypothetical protein VMU22_07540 [Rhizomicrobium sp.]|nr:hypothetical protein [Rhizomicrobium sp.]
MSDASDDPVAEAVRAAAAEQRSTSAAQSQVKPINGERENFWEALGSHLTHEAKSALAQVGRAEVEQSYNNLAVAADASDEIRRTLNDYADYRAQILRDEHGHPVEVPAIDTSSPALAQSELMIRLAAKLPLTRPATNADWIDPLFQLLPLAAAGAGPAFRLIGTGATIAADASASGGAAIDAATDSVWALSPMQRGVAIEQKLAATEYVSWYHVGQEYNGYFPLVDFQQENTLASLRTVDTTSSRWFARTWDHIEDLGNNGATLNGNRANMTLDLRVQPGGFEAAQPLVKLGKENGVTVLIKEFP